MMYPLTYHSLFYLKAREENRMSNENFEIERWGKEWQKFMKENYPAEAAELVASNRWNELALKIDREAWALWDLLREQYAKDNPRPITFMEIVKWENTRGFYVDHEVMEQVVLQFRA